MARPLKNEPALSRHRQHYTDRHFRAEAWSPSYLYTCSIRHARDCKQLFACCLLELATKLVTVRLLPVEFLFTAFLIDILCRTAARRVCPGPTRRFDTDIIAVHDTRFIFAGHFAGGYRQRSQASRLVTRIKRRCSRQGPLPRYGCIWYAPASHRHDLMSN
jgi:hypothetical protein